MKTIICLLFIVLNKFFCKHVLEKKIVPHQAEASPHVTDYYVCVLERFSKLPTQN